MRHPLFLLLIPILLALASCGDEDGSCTGEFCTAPVGDSSSACRQLSACCEQLLEDLGSDGGDVYRARCLKKLEAISRQASPATACGQAVDSLVDWNYCTAPEEEEDSSSTAICDELIACAEEVAPDTLPTLRQTYGASGTCWTSSAEIKQACLDSCQQAIDAYHDSGSCGGGEDGSTDTYNFPDWVVYDEEIITYCEYEVACTGAVDSPEDPIRLRIRECEDRMVRWMTYGPPPCDEQLRAELACRLERASCDTDSWCGPESDEACSPRPVSPGPPP